MATPQAITPVGPGSTTARVFRGFLFNNPDREAHLDFAQKIDPAATRGWGNIVTPDEMRMIYFMGNSRLVTVNGAYLDDVMLQGWIDQTVNALSEELQHDIYPRLWRHRDPNNSVMRNIEPHAEWDDAYDYFNQSIADHFYLRLRRKPLVKVLAWKLDNPYTEQNIIDLMPSAKITYATGELRSVAIGRNVQGLTSNLRTWRLYQRGVGNQRVPGSYYVDYVSGYDTAERVPHDLRTVAAKVLAIAVMSAYGDGLVGGLANFSISVGVLSESVGTTMSATNAFFGARIGQFKDELKVWYDQNLTRYRGIRMAIL